MERKDNRICSKCKYPLQGLPRVGNCPECGSGFNTATGEGVSYPLSDRQSADQFGMKLKIVLLCVGLVCMIGFIGFHALQHTEGKTFWWLTGVVAAFIALMLADTMIDQYNQHKK